MSIGWPEGIYLALTFIMICVHASNNGQPRKGDYDLGVALLGSALSLGLLWWGGFFA